MVDYRCSIAVVNVERSKEKNGPTTVIFDLACEGYPAVQTSVFVDRHYPDEFVEKVAGTFLHRRLLALAKEAEHGTYTEEEVKALFARFKPAHYPSE